MKTTAVHQSTPPSVKGDGKALNRPRDAKGQFVVAVANMSWQLLIVVLVPIIGGAELDRRAGGQHLWVYFGLVLAAVAATAVVWRAVRLAASLPVPKLTAAQKRAIQQSYKEDDDDD